MKRVGGLVGDLVGALVGGVLGLRLATVAVSLDNPEYGVAWLYYCIFSTSGVYVGGKIRQWLGPD